MINQLTASSRAVKHKPTRFWLSVCARVLMILLLLSLSNLNSVNAQQSLPIESLDTFTGDHVSTCKRPQDEVWMISSRHLDDPCRGVEALEYYRAVDGCWIPESVDGFLQAEANDQPRQTILMFHGHLTNFKFAQIRGWQAYQKIVAADPEAIPVRFVLWAWPSEFLYTGEIKRMTSFRKADVHAFYLGQLLLRMRPEQPVHIIGYSYGSRIVVGALHLANGGQVDGKGIERCSECDIGPYLVTLIEPTIHADDFACGRHYDRAFPSIQHLVLIHNPRDPALKAFRACPYTGFGRVMGTVGIVRLNTPEDWQRIEQYNAGSTVGPQHAMNDYFDSPWLLQKMRSNIYLGAQPSSSPTNNLTLPLQ
jgi:hypothetical protein